MSHWKSYAGSIVLAGLLLQGCGGGDGSSSDTQENTATDSSLKTVQRSTVRTIDSLSDTVNSLDENSTDKEIKAAFDKLKLKLSKPETTAKNAPQRSNVLTKLTDKVKDKLVGALDTKAGNKVTGAAFDVVLNSDGVTVVMLDLARKSDTTSQVMVDALAANWQLTEKMCPMLRENKEFGEKFTALAEEKESVAKFFFERIDANMYACLTDAMLLSNKDAQKGEYKKPVSHSTNGYMALLMDRYAKDYFIAPTGSTADRRPDKFVSLLLDTGAVADYNDTSKTFENHGDGNELTNEKFFYSLFKTPATTEAFVSAMGKVDVPTRTMLMDDIFLGQYKDNNDTLQGELNIIAIGSSMYDGIYGEKGTDGNRTGAYGLAAYTSSFIGFAGLIPSDRYLTYGKAFINAGYEYAKIHGIDVWAGVSDAVVSAWDSYTAPETTTVSNDPSRSAGKGVESSQWFSNIKDLMYSAWNSVDYGDLYDAIMDSNSSITTEVASQAKIAYQTIVDGRNDNNQTVYPTEISNDLTVHNDTVYGFHGLIELAMQEDVYYLKCGSRSTDYYLGGAETCKNDANYTMADAKKAFTLPPFADLTWSFGYNTAKEGAMAYMGTIDSAWFADLSTNELVRQYFYPSADNAYIPNWMLAIDWLKVPATYDATHYANFDFNFNSGYLDIYVVSDDADLNSSIGTGLSDLTGVTMTKVDMGSDTIITVDETGTNSDGHYVYKIRVISPKDTQAVLDYLSGLGNDALTAVGLDSSNTANVDTTAAN